MSVLKTTAYSSWQSKKAVGKASLSGSMPLSMTKPGIEVTVQSIHGKDETKRFLESLGFVEKTKISVITELGGNVIVNVKGTRVAISKTMANRIYTQ